MHSNSTTIKQLELIAEALPALVYWLDTNSVILGANSFTVKALGASCLDEIVGKTPYDIYPNELAEHIVKHNKKVIATGICLSQEEGIRDVLTGKMRYYTASKSPLRNDSGDIIGLVGSSIEISVEKEEKALMLETLKKNSTLKHLQSLASLFPIPIYWNDLDSAVLGANELALAGAGASSINNVLGKTPYELYPEHMAELIVKHNETVIRTGQILSQEEIIRDVSTGKIRYYAAFKAPLRDEDGITIGTLGISIETTAEKEAESLKLENERKEIALQEKEKFVTMAHKVAHDINSPLTTLKMMMPSCSELQEKKRNILNQAIESILDIANNLLSTYRNEEQQTTVGTEPRQSILIADVLVQVVSEKKVQFSNLSVKLETDIAPNAHFAFSQMQPSQLRRSISNLINNAVDAIDGKSNGLVTVKLAAYSMFILITIQDNGKGMSPDMKRKMLSRQSFSEGKEHGHGLGLQQIWDTVDQNQGVMKLDSAAGVGTTITLGFPRIKAPEWIAHKIEATFNGTVVILDDDESIHGAWDIRFRPYLDSNPKFQSRHFTHGQDVLEFFDGLDPETRGRVVFLSDFELINQSKDGLEIIKESGIKNATLVTSYYANQKIRDRATHMGVKVLPKQMASVVPISINAN